MQAQGVAVVNCSAPAPRHNGVCCLFFGIFRVVIAVFYCKAVKCCQQCAHHHKEHNRKNNETPQGLACNLFRHDFSFPPQALILSSRFTCFVLQFSPFFLSVHVLLLLCFYSLESISRCQSDLNRTFLKITCARAANPPVSTADGRICVSKSIK